MSESEWRSLTAGHQRARSAAIASSSSDGQPPRHQPSAAVLACSDARVPPSVIFDQPAGKLFVVRIAGNTASPAALASLDYAVAELGVDLIVVLGHTSCGAVTAAAQGVCGGHFEPVTSPICEIAREHPDAHVDELAALNVADTMDALAAHDGPTGCGLVAGSVEIRGALHDLVTGELMPIKSARDARHGRAGRAS